MKQAAKALGFLALAGTLLPPLLFLNQSMSEATMKLVLLVSAVAWFVSAPFWMRGGD
ncbi:MAG: hypothetical protein AB7O66_22640 [Limisphaerales bacterium]